jgi:enoyl-CoA hydratase
VSRHGGVLLLTLNRPRQRNALNLELREALRAAFDAYEQDDALRCAVLTGNGPAFCAGGDLKEMAASSMSSPPAEMSLLLGSNGYLSKPVIAAVNGFALAGGFRLAQECDICLAAESASFAITEVRRGRGAPWATPLINMMSQRAMAEILFTGEPITAVRARQIGFVNQVVPDDQLVRAALTMARTIASNAPLSVQAAKAMIRMVTGVHAEDASAQADALYKPVYLSADAQEGPRAFAENREPVWTGS